ncbi:acyltransferase [Sphingobacterium rhinopitheci]|uniref:acyltransferase n=1 Tax=Sphingobacterium rhinopitheci TaxID=2781960 RepID=UPI001F523E4B|nr:acyltransferase family protein [Sphingobacterium rhinopitheci]MCI0920359.1 acyltransferase family protein [Sphingobacterium rhinopitheci]
MVEKNIYISYLRVIATIFVVLIHASTGFLNHFDSYSFNWNYANWINAATRCAVPLFVALSGALLLSKEENTLIFYKKRFPKILYPFAFWTLIYLIYYFYRYTNFTALPISQVLNIARDKVLHGANAHLWYVYMIVGLYFTIPFLKKIILLASMREIEIFLVLWFLSMFVNYKIFYDYVPKIDLTFFSGYVGYLVLGYYLSKKTISLPRSIPYIAYFLVILFTGYITWYLSAKIHKLDPIYYNYNFFNTALATAFLFLALKITCADKHTMPKWVTLIDQYSFSIYLIHILPLNYIHPWISKYMDTVYVIPVATVLSIAASMIIAYIIRLIPGGKYISG